MRYVAKMDVDVRGTVYSRGEVIDQTIDPEGKSAAEIETETAHLNGALDYLEANGRACTVPDTGHVYIT